MRFAPNGPSIPDQLLERRDAGRVVFFCGAGISLKAKMPSFVDLTKSVVDFFDPPSDSAIATALQPWRQENQTTGIPLDQIFYLLYQEFGREEVEALVAKQLRPKVLSASLCDQHEIIKRISSDQEGRPQVVTTNFDHLFEFESEEDDKVPLFVPPRLPDISLGETVTGITYLHGRISDGSAAQRPLILSSADFGRAYLSEAWATDFVRSLLQNYTVVLLGYKAEDPPIRYLLQGLHHDNYSDRSKLYAFDKGAAEDIEPKWRDRGVTPIAFPQYSDLWSSLDAWARRATDPRLWRQETIELAKKNPRRLSAVQRGQVAHVVSSTAGAKHFANAEPTPPAEWLCVFDSTCRGGEVARKFGDNPSQFDPLEIYGLDDDPPRSVNEVDQGATSYRDILMWHRGDTSPSAQHNLSGHMSPGVQKMPPRIRHLARWISCCLDSPVAAWWVARQRGLHPNLLAAIRRELRLISLPAEARRQWSLTLESHQNGDPFARDHAWYDVIDFVKKNGWTAEALTAYDAATRPFVEYRAPNELSKSKPPWHSWTETQQSEMPAWEVSFPERDGENLNVPDEMLCDVFSIEVKQLQRATGLYEMANASTFRTRTCYPRRSVEGDGDTQDHHFLSFVKLFDRMAEQHPEQAYGYSLLWPIEDRHYFRMLKLYAWNHRKLYDAKYVARELLRLEPAAFWDFDSRRELLFLVGDRWKDFPSKEQEELAHRFIAGPPRWKRWPDENHADRRDYIALRYLKWLRHNGATYTEEQEHQIAEMTHRLGGSLGGEDASSLVTEHQIRSGFIRTDETSDNLENLKIGKIADRALSEIGRRFDDSFVEKNPFRGLVKRHPRKALAALTHSARLGEYPKALWSELMSNWPDACSARLNRVYLLRLSRLPAHAVRDLAHDVGRWGRDSFPSVYRDNHSLAWTVYDNFVSGLATEGGSGSRSGLGETRLAGRVIGSSRRTIDHAINGPVGSLTDGLLRALNSLELNQGIGIPSDFTSRLQALMQSPGEGNDHVVSILCRQLSWLYHIDSDWVQEEILPWLRFEHNKAEPAWNGYLAAAQIPPQALGEKITPQLVQLFPRINDWDWQQRLASIAAQMIVQLVIYRKGEPDGLTESQARHCIRNMDEQCRREAISQLGRIGTNRQGGWVSHVIPFIENVWPRERAFRTSGLVAAWISMLDDSGSNFPAVLAAVRRHLVPVDGTPLWLHRFSMVSDETSLTERFPNDVLTLLDAVVPNSPAALPYNLSEMLDQISEADSDLRKDRRFTRLVDLIDLL